MKPALFLHPEIARALKKKNPELYKMLNVAETEKLRKGKEMTDKDEYIKLMKRFGCQPKVDGNTVTLKEGRGSVGGYTRFYVDFEFDSEGKFVNAGVFE